MNENPADDPTREVELRRASEALPAWWVPLALGDFAPFEDWLRAQPELAPKEGAFHPGALSEKFEGQPLYDAKPSKESAVRGLRAVCKGIDKKRQRSAARLGVVQPKPGMHFQAFSAQRAADEGSNLQAFCVQRATNERSNLQASCGQLSTNEGSNLQTVCTQRAPHEGFNLQAFCAQRGVESTEGTPLPADCLLRFPSEPCLLPSLRWWEPTGIGSMPEALRNKVENDNATAA